MHTFLVILLSQDKRTILQSNLYISKSWSVTIIIATLLLSYTSGYVTILFYFFGVPSLLIFYCKINFFGAKCDAIHAIINSNYLLSILKAPFNIECHFLFILLYIHTHTQYILLLNHWATLFTYFLFLLFFFKLFFSLLSTKKTKTKTSSSSY